MLAAWQTGSGSFRSKPILRDSYQLQRHRSIADELAGNHDKSALSPLCSQNRSVLDQHHERSWGSKLRRIKQLQLTQTRADTQPSQNAAIKH